MLRRVGVLILVVLLVPTVACGGTGRKKRGGSSGSDGGNSTSDNRGAAKGGGPQSFDIGKTVWYAGMKLTFGKLSYDPAKPADSQLTIDTTVENVAPTGVQGSPAFTIKLNDAFIQGRFDTGLGTVPAGETSKTVIEFLPTGDPGTLADGVLQVGSSETVQALVPLGGSGDLVDLKPVTLLDQPVVKTTPRGKLWFNTCSLQADLPSDHDQVEKDMRTIVCYMDVQETAGRTGGEYMDKGNFLVRLPDGSVVNADEAPIQAFYQKKKITNKEIIFKIKWPAPGAYTIEVEFAGGTASVPVTLGSP
jgi:hypothetical protein